ncbi:MAG: glycosyltransferase family 2 protein [Candidatus Krumholzibacteriia bacterium]
MSEITAFLMVKNEEELLPACLDSLAGCIDRIEVLDTGSSDGTRALLAARAAAPEGPPLDWAATTFRGFGPTRQQSLERVRTPWALWIDADEIVSPELARRLRELRASGELDRHQAWRIRRVARVLGRTMKQRNLANDRVLRLFRTDLGRISDSVVHEGVSLPAGASVGWLAEPLWHDTMIRWRDYLAKVDHYTTLDAERRLRDPSWFHLATGGPLTFLRNYVGRGGVRDGWPGLVWAATSAWSTWLLDWKLLRGAGRGPKSADRRSRRRP